MLMPDVTMIDWMGDDLTVVNAARVSFAKESSYVSYETDEFDHEADTHVPKTKKLLKDADVRLIHYLARNRHWTPFAHPQATFHIRAPIFVARQLGKHQVGMVWNEVSRRYVDDEPDFWLPRGSWRTRPEGSIKQGSGDGQVPLQPRTWAIMQEAVDEYSRLIADGVAPEQARAVLPQGTYTEWWWTGSLYAFSRVCRLRMDPHAQQETRSIAASINFHMTATFPVSWNALLGDINDSGT
jgi:thymidylate synthase (FAD)